MIRIETGVYGNIFSKFSFIGLMSRVGYAFVMFIFIPAFAYFDLIARSIDKWWKNKVMKNWKKYRQYADVVVLYLL